MSKTAVIYCRVSTTKQEKEGESLENQERACREYCKSRWIQVIWAYKEAFTWKSKNRPVFQEAIKNAYENKVNYFIIFDIDRFSREGYGVYSNLKEDLESHWVILQDIKNVIRETTIVHRNDLVDMSKYKWNTQNDWEIVEAFYSTQAKSEWKKILQRTIPREIQLEQQGYKVRASNFWYLNKKINTSIGKPTIQIEHPIEWKWMIEIFENRAKWHLSDEQIVEWVNLKGYQSREWNKLTVKQLQMYIKMPIYAWIVVTKWTWNKPIKAPYKGLVSIDIWNRANRGKIKIVELDDKDVVIEYNNGKQKQVNLPIIEKRKDYNPEYPFSKVLLCPHCQNILTPNTSRSSTGELHFYYQCKWKWWVKHKNYSLKRVLAEEKIQEMLSTVKVHQNDLDLFDLICDKVYQERKGELKESNQEYDKQIQLLKDKESHILKNLNNILSFPAILEAKNKELEEIKSEIYKIELKKKESWNDTNLEKFKYYWKKVITRLDKLLLQRQNPELIGLVFDIVFNGKIEFEKISYHTSYFRAFRSYQSQQKNPSEEEFSSKSVMAAPLGVEPSTQDLESWIIPINYGAKALAKARG